MVFGALYVSAVAELTGRMCMKNEIFITTILCAISHLALVDIPSPIGSRWTTCIIAWYYGVKRVSQRVTLLSVNFAGIRFCAMVREFHQGLKFTFLNYEVGRSSFWHRVYSQLLRVHMDQEILRSIIWHEI